METSFENEIIFETERVPKKQKLQFLKYCKICEEEKQSRGETRDIRKEHSKKVQIIDTLIVRLQYTWNLTSSYQ